MSSPESLIRNISDTARWAAMYRARESDRPDAVFRDPFAKRLAGSRGQEIATRDAIQRTSDLGLDRPDLRLRPVHHPTVAQGVDMVVNLAAGLDARPYRMDLPAALNGSRSTFPSFSLTRKTS